MFVRCYSMMFVRCYSMMFVLLQHVCTLLQHDVLMLFLCISLLLLHNVLQVL